MVDDDGRAVGDRLAKEESFAGCSATQKRERGEPQPEIEVPALAGAKTSQRALPRRRGHVGGSHDSLGQTSHSRFHLSTVVPSSPDHSNRMQNKKLVRAVIWVIVISMVLALGVSVIASL